MIIMASDSGITFGFELLQRISGEVIDKKEDVLVLFVHWYFVKNGFKCLGLGDSKVIEATEVGSELLPTGWNQGPNYTLRYVKEGKLYILMAIKSEGDLLLNLLRIEDHSVSNVQFPIDTVGELRGPLERLIPSYENVLTVLKRDFVEPVYSGSGREVSTQTVQPEAPRRVEDDDPLRVGPPRRPVNPVVPGLPRGDPFSIGRDDLNPFGQGGGGMLFDPFGNRGGPNRPFPGLGVPGRLPPGAVPPGARFDPFGPPDNEPPVPRARVPDADHMPPPGYDDMFM